MITLDIEQGTAAWIEARLGIPTASNFGRIVTPTGKLSSQRDAYIAELCAEYVLGEPVSDFQGNEAVERGKVLENEARAYYEFQTDIPVEGVGFVYRCDDRMVGCSPDGLVGTCGGLELKCPQASTHLRWLAEGKLPTTHFAQVQGCIWVCGAEWWDFMSYFPNLPPLIVRVEPDEKYQAALDEHIPKFIADMLSKREYLQAMGATL